MGFLTPYLTYVKVALVVAALTAAGWVGHEWTRRGYEANEARNIAAATAKYEASVDAYKANIAALEKTYGETVSQYQTKVAKLATNNQKLTKDITNATKNQPACSITAGFGSVWNDSINRANGRVPAGTEDTTGVASADGRATDVTRADLLTNHDAVMQQCGKWKAQLDSIIEWDAKTK